MKSILKVDFHLHSSEDWCEKIGHDSFQLVETAWRHGFDAISITNHDMVAWGEQLREYAASFDILLIPGVELTLKGRHVLVIGADHRLDGVRSLEDLAFVRDDSMLIVAPHPFFPFSHGLGRRLYEYLELFDALELCHLYRPALDFNRPTLQLAGMSGLPVAAFSDAHALWQFGHNYSLVTAEKSVESIFQAVRQGDITPHARPIQFFRALRTMGWIAASKLSGLLQREKPTGSLRWVNPSHCAARRSALAGAH